MRAHIHTETDERIFVFGSNLLGIHGAGAARYAHERLGFPWGLGEGLAGRAYAIPTCSEPGVPLSLEEVRGHVERFLDTARAVKASGVAAPRFFVSEVGCGFAGFTPAQIAPLFDDAPANCDLPPGWGMEPSDVG